MKRQATICGILCTAVDFWLVPTFLARGVPDFIWLSLMVIFPVILAFYFLKNYPPKSVLWCALTQCLLVLVFANPISNVLGLRLGDINYDLLDYINYGFFTFGWIAAATLGQFLALIIYRKIKK